MYEPVVSGEFEAANELDPLMRWFAYDHLPERLQVVSSQFATVALWTATHLPRSAERTVALRKLLEAKDAAVRARMGDD